MIIFKHESKDDTVEKIYGSKVYEIRFINRDELGLIIVALGIASKEEWIKLFDPKLSEQFRLISENLKTSEVKPMIITPEDED